MKKHLVLALVTTVLASSAVAEGFDNQFYVGLEANRNWAKVDGDYAPKADSNGKILYPKHAGSLGVFAGTRLYQNFGVEFGASMQKPRHVYLRNYDQSIRTTNLSVDALGSLPFNESLNILGSVGVGRLAITETTKKDANNWTDTHSNAKLGMRMGIGAEFLFGDSYNFGARAMLRYQKGNRVISHVRSGSLGLFYIL